MLPIGMAQYMTKQTNIRKRIQGRGTIDAKEPSRCNTIGQIP